MGAPRVSAFAHVLHMLFACIAHPRAQNGARDWRMHAFSNEKPTISDGRADGLRYRTHFAHAFGAQNTPMRAKWCARLANARIFERKTNDFGRASRAAPLSRTFCTCFLERKTSPCAQIHAPDWRLHALSSEKPTISGGSGGAGLQN